MMSRMSGGGCIVQKLDRVISSISKSEPDHEGLMDTEKRPSHKRLKWNKLRNQPQSQFFHPIND